MSDEDPDREPTIAEALSHSVDPVPAKKRGPVARLRNYFLTGIIVTAPVAITLWILIGVIELIDGAVVPLIPPAYNPQTFFLRYFDIEIHIPGIGLVVVLIGLTLIGFVAAGFFGRIIVRAGERIVNRMPVVRSVYGALKQIFQTVLESSSQSFREVVLMHAVARLALHPHIRNIQVSWVKLGADGARACLGAGANDLGGTLMNESISRAAGTTHGQEMSPATMEALIGSIGRAPLQRTTLYRPVDDDRHQQSLRAAELEPVVLTAPARRRA